MRYTRKSGENSMISFKNYYRILNVGLHASPADIRRAFRRLAKKYHPDTSEYDPDSAASHMRALLEAYRILMDEEKRRIYNLRFKGRLEREETTFGEFLRGRGDDPYARALLVFYNLLSGRRKEAISIYEYQKKEYGESVFLRELLGFADYLDCVFLLGEAYEFSGRFAEAAHCYEEAYREDLKWSYFRHFRLEVKHRIRTIFCRHLARDADPETSIRYYRVLLEEYAFPRHDRAFFWKKIAERYCEMNEYEIARECLAEAERLKPRLTGTKKLRVRLETVPPETEKDPGESPWKN